MLIEVWRYGPGTVSHVHEKNHAFSDVDEETYVAATLSLMLKAPPLIFVFHATDALTTENLPTEQAHARICQLFANSWTLAPNGLIGQGVVIFR